MSAAAAESRPGSYEVRVEDVEYLRHDGQPLRARIFRPLGKGPFPAMVDAHGGAWIQGTCENNDPINRPVSQGGIVVVSVDYRVPPQGTYPSSVADVNYAVRWLKMNAARFSSRPDLVGVMGTSSGGHLAVLAAMKPDDPRYSALPLPGGAAFDARPSCVVAMWPVICPFSRFRDVLERQARGEPHPSGRVGGGTDQMKYWLTEDAMADGSPLLALERGDKVIKPDLLYVQTATDTMHPRASMEQFVASYRKAGGHLEVELVEGEPYDLVRSKSDSASARQAVERIIAFIQQKSAKAGGLRGAG
jgi:acetyl esterase